ncbi:MAG: hypothetical protein BWZ10_02820 [candidate division BRC1 bacterium ADurb.BinA364]|nr:MAG: hypothetical protein BWZ10_02820 [candidate division BRC1 bacterium ADurb.BinA364]
MAHGGGEPRRMRHAPAKALQRIAGKRAGQNAPGAQRPFQRRAQPARQHAQGPGRQVVEGIDNAGRSAEPGRRHRQARKEPSGMGGVVDENHPRLAAADQKPERGELDRNAKVIQAQRQRSPNARARLNRFAGCVQIEARTHAPHGGLFAQSRRGLLRRGEEHTCLVALLAPALRQPQEKNRVAAPDAALREDQDAH